MRLLVFIIACLISSAAHSRDAKVGDTTVKVSPPAGFCEVDKTKKADSGWLASTTDLLKGSGVFTIAAFPDCGDLKKSRQSDQFIASKVLITAPFSNIGNASSATVTETCDELRTKKYSDEEKAEMAKTGQWQFRFGQRDTRHIGRNQRRGLLCWNIAKGEDKSR
jgi:hypothetical protein